MRRSNLEELSRDSGEEETPNGEFGLLEGMVRPGGRKCFLG